MKKIIFIFALIFLISLNFVSAETPWWNNSFSYRSNFTINSSLIDSDLTNWTLIITHDVYGMQNENGPLDADGLKPALNGGGDLRFTDNDGNRLGVDIRTFTTNNNPTQAQAEIAILIPNVSSSEDTTIWMYWGNTTEASQPAVDEEYGQYSAYDDNYLLVSSDGGKTKNVGSLNLLPSTTSPDIISGKMGYSSQIGSENEYYGGLFTESYPLTMSFLMRRDNAGGASMVTLSTSDQYDGHLFLGLTDTVFRAAYYETDFGGFIDFGGTPLVEDNNWVYGSVVFASADNLTSYLNGEFSGSLAGNHPYPESIDTISVGRLYRSNIGYYPQGSYDELRISSTNRSASWIKANYNNFMDLEALRQKSVF
jgi:trimeric autotransporter adhesin